MALANKDGGGHSAQPAAPTELNLEVTPENVVAYGVVFAGETDRFDELIKELRGGLRVEPWLGDATHPEPVATWAAARFNQKYDELVQRLTELRDQYQNMAEALRQSAAEYGKTDELNKALLDRQHK